MTDLERLIEDRDADPTEVRVVVQAERDRVALAALPEGGRAVCRALQDLVDGVVLACHRRATAGKELPVALYALGGYGRGELAPRSDVDVLLLFRDPVLPVVERYAEILFGLLWDVGLEVGHQGRSPSRCLEGMESDLATATALLESRFLVGDPALRTDLQDSAIETFISRRRTAFLTAKLDESLARRRSRGASASVMEPWVKEGQGGLRDLHLIHAVALATRRTHREVLEEASPPAAGDLGALEAAHDLLLRVRAAMHILEGRRADHLDMALQPRVAELLGYADEPESLAVECFMRDYYLAARRIERFHDLLVGELSRRRRTTQVRRPLDAGFVAVNGRIHLEDPTALSLGSRDLLLAVFEVAHRQGMPLADEVLEGVRRNLHRVDDAFRNDHDLGRRFMDLLDAQRGVASVLKQMHRSGLLGEYLPEFGAVNCLVRYDAYHEFTVDEHTIRALECLEDHERPGPIEDTLRRERYRLLPHRHVLRLALLLHDTGKAMGAGHSATGAALVPDIARRLGLKTEEADELAFLIGHHVDLSRTAESRDIADPATVEGLARVVATEARLHLLYLLTCADVRAVGKGAWTGWKDVLITELYRKVHTTLAGKETPPASDYVDRVSALLTDEADRGRLAEHLALVPVRYSLEVEPADAVRHLALTTALGDQPLVLATTPRQGHTEACIVTRDRPARFAQIAGALAACGLDIVSAQAYTRRDGIVIDRFLAIEPEGERPDRVWAETERTLIRVLTGEADLETLLARRARRIPVGPVYDQPFPPRVQVSNKVSPKYTIVDVSVQDRQGVLYRLASTFSRLGLDIHFARITTQAHRALDAFYITKDGKKLTDPDATAELQTALLEIGRQARDGPVVGETDSA